MMDRYQQGDLDGLCGVYATINAIDRTLYAENIAFTEDNAKKLFYKLCKRIEANGELAYTIENGIKKAEMLKDLIDFSVRSVLKSHHCRITVRPSSYKDFDHFWSEMGAHLCTSAKSVAIILCLKEPPLDVR